MKISGWGRFPVIETRARVPRVYSQIASYLEETAVLIPRGLGRSYGDSSLAQNTLHTTALDHFIAFDHESGEISCGAGLSLGAILEECVPKGWFLPVTPGTKFVTVGGAIASDVHGKNHHIAGCFCEHITALTVMVADGTIHNCSAIEHADLFQATCGGMGLTGLILEATIQLRPIRSAYIDQTIYKARNLEELLDLFRVHQGITYSVAWIDCLATGARLGRSLLMLGEHAEGGGLHCGKEAALSIPCDMPGMVLNRVTVAAFNSFYYHRIVRKISHQKIHYGPFFYPLDSLQGWNRIYGKKGFTQYQFVLPAEGGLAGMRTILGLLARSKRGSFLAVLKAFGPQNSNYLSFPLQGYTLALDLKIDPGLFALLTELDEIVLDYGGRVYLTKDVRMEEDMFKKSYPGLVNFMKVRLKYDPLGKFASLQSQRIGI